MKLGPRLLLRACNGAPEYVFLQLFEHIELDVAPLELVHQPIVLKLRLFSYILRLDALVELRLFGFQYVSVH